MIALGIFHIAILLTSYIGYFFIFMQSLSGKTDFRVLTAANALYVIGFALGMLWAKIAWGFYISPDIKFLLSIALFVPYLAENILRTKRWHLPTIGAVILVANYVVPIVLNSVHTH